MSPLNPLLPAPDRLGLLTDLYELTMAAGYFAAGMADKQATFELFIRDLPPTRNYLVAAGLEQALAYLVQLQFTGEDLDYLRGLEVFRHVPAGWYEALRELRFAGEVWAVPEGTAVFAEEPLLRVTAPIIEAQIVETCLLTSIAFQTAIASKSARVVTAAEGRSVVDFGSRRAHGPQAGLLAARAAYVGGSTGTSNVLAARELGIPPVGTMAHSWVMAFEDEREAFAQYARVFPENAIFLIDTYDTVEGARRAASCGAVPHGVRLDSGDLVSLSRQVRAVLDEAGLKETNLFGSGDLDEHKIHAFSQAGAPLDAYGVGTELVTSKDAPALGAVYKLVEFHADGEHVGRIKLSTGKKTYPFKKQVFRRSDAQGTFRGDTIGRWDESLEGRPMLERVMTDGKLTGPLPSLDASRQRCRDQLACLPHELLDLDRRVEYPVGFSDALERAAEELARQR
jgi:nicotinate phosphoribosyltransferase